MHTYILISLKLLFKVEAVVLAAGMGYSAYVKIVIVFYVVIFHLFQLI